MRLYIYRQIITTYRCYSSTIARRGNPIATTSVCTLAFAVDAHFRDRSITIMGTISVIIKSAVLRQYVAAFTASLSVMMSGAAFSWITPLLVHLLGPNSEVPMTREQSSWVVSSIEIGNLLTPLPCGMLVDWWGRKPCLIITAPMYTISWILVLTTRSVEVLYIVRTIQGIGMGIIYTVLPMYLGEIAEPKYRGALSTIFEVMWYLGVLSEYCIGPFVTYQTLAMYSSTIPVLYFITFILMPESPYYLLMRNRDHEAANNLAWLRGTNSASNVDTELKAMKFNIEEEMAQKSASSWKDLISTPANRRTLLIVQVVAILEVVSGITAIISYVTETLASTKDSFLTADQFTILIGICILVSTIISAVSVDRVGRRPILLISCIGASLCQIVSGAYFYLDAKTSIDVSDYSWIAFISISLYTVLLCGGVGAISTTVQSEFFPSHTRGLASGLTTMSINIASFICMKMYQSIEDNVGIFLNFWLYSFCGILGAIFIYFLLPETKGKTFAEIQHELSKLNVTDDDGKIVKAI